MKTYICNIGNIVFQPSVVFKPYSVSWTRKLVFDSGYHEKVLNLPRRKYFGDFYPAVLFRRRMLADFYLQSRKN